MPQLFESNRAFHNAFADGLQGMLAYEGLGGLILVAANACMESTLSKQLDKRLQLRCQQAEGQIRESLQLGQPLSGSEDDLLVFLKMVMIGYESLQLAQFRTLEGGWELQYNPLRALRPPRVAHQQIHSHHAPFNEAGFHFNLPFLRKEMLWSGELEGRMVDLLYNKFPFVAGHTLLVPEREHCAPQYLTEGDHRHIWKVAQGLGRSLNGVGVGYNSYGANASVNHLHFQLFLQERNLPIEASHWQHLGGEDDYPVAVEVYDDQQMAWSAISRCHIQGWSYNLLYRPGRLYLIPRARQGSIELAPWCSGLAWYEMCGATVCFNRELYQQLTATQIRQQLARARLG